MNKKQLLVCAICLVFGGTAWAQVRVDIDPEFRGKVLGAGSQTYRSMNEALILLTNQCDLEPALKLAVTDVVSGERTRMGCSDVKRLREAAVAEAKAKDKARVEAVPKYTVFAQAQSGEWKRGGIYDTAEKGRAGAERQCVDRHIPGRLPNKAAKFVDPSGQEVVIQCPTRK